jgi:hypothetical protein
MPRIAKAAVNLAVDRVVADVKSNEPIISPVEQAAVDQFKGWAAHRAGSTDDVAAYAKQHLLAKYDENHDGYSKAEIGKMSKLGQAFVALAVEMKSKKIPDIASFCDFISETDSSPTFVSSSSSDVLTAFPDALHATFGPDLSGLVADTSGDANALLDQQSSPSDPSEPFSVDEAAAWTKLAGALRAQLTDVHLVKVGAPGGDVFEYFILGTAKDGKTAGVAFKSVET